MFELKYFRHLAKEKLQRHAKCAASFLVGMAACAFLATAAENPKNYLIYYDTWNDTDIVSFQEYEMVVLQNQYSGLNIQNAIAAIKAGPNNTKVLLYTSLGEDRETFGLAQGAATPRVGNGQGPCYFDNVTGQLVYENQGVASFYIDEHVGNGTAVTGHDNAPDTHGDWGAAYVNTGDPAWQDIVIADCQVLIDAGADGFFLDTPETPAPWYHMGWSAQGMHDLIKKIDATCPTNLLLLNRGNFFFDPDYPHQYKWNPGKYIDYMLFESYAYDSAYTSSLATVVNEYNRSPYMLQNKFYSRPKVQAILSLYGVGLLGLDYAENPDLFNDNYYTDFADAVSIGKYGILELVSDRLLKKKPLDYLTNNLPVDADAPVWDNTALTYASAFAAGQMKFHEVQGAELTDAILSTMTIDPRIGVQDAVPGNQQVTLRWDLATDQSGPIKYNIYYQEGSSLNFATATILKGINPTLSAAYGMRTFSSLDKHCPIEYVVTELQNGQQYTFAVRAEDSTTGATPITGHTGPHGGIEDINTVVISATPTTAKDVKIAIDGNFSDWSNVKNLGNEAGDVLDSANDIEFISTVLGATHLFIRYETLANRNGSPYSLLIDADENFSTGYHGAEILVQSGLLYQHNGAPADFSWILVRALGTNEVSDNGKSIELQLSKTEIGMATGSKDVIMHAFSDWGAYDKYPSTGVATRFISVAQESEVLTTPSIDGHFSHDWTLENQIFVDGQDVSNAAIDIDIIHAVQTDADIYLSWSYIGIAAPTLWNVLIDADENTETGYFGSDIMVQNGLVYQYNGVANSWNWVQIGVVPYVQKGQSIELKVSKALLNVPQNMTDLTFRVNASDGVISDDAPAVNQVFAIKKSNTPAVGQANHVANGAIVLDADFSDWENVKGFGLDAASAPPASGNTYVDWGEVKWAHDDNNFYLLYQNQSVISVNWKFQCFLDTDASKATGYTGAMAGLPHDLGAEYLLEGFKMYKYVGTGLDWNWTFVGDLGRIWTSTAGELYMPRSWIENPTRIDLIYYGNNQQEADLSDDYYPNNAFNTAAADEDRHFTYRVTAE